MLWAFVERARERWPRRPSVVEGERARTYAETAARCTGLAAELSARGIQPGERVALLEENSGAFLESSYAVAGLGAILVPLDVRLTAPELVVVLRDAAPVAWIANAAYADKVAAVAAELTGLARVVWVGGSGAPVAVPAEEYEALVVSERAFEPHVASDHDVAQLYYTSGTTGRAKGVMLTHKNVAAHAQAATSELDLAEDDVWGHFAPMFHLADAWATFALTWVGGAHVMLPRFDAARALALLARHDVTVTNVVPTMLQRMLAVLPANATFPALRLLLSGGAPIAPAVVAEVLERFGCEYAQTYGMTETSPYLTLGLLQPHHRELPAAQQLAKRARTGRAFETVELEVVDDTGLHVPRDDHSVGEIRVRGVTVTPGYWNRPEETAAAIRDGWLYTGDLARIDREGYVDIVDRKKDIVLTGGETVYSTEVEAALYESAGVLEAAVYGVPHPDWGEELRAAVVPREAGLVDEAGLKQLCRARLAGYKCPKRIAIVDELPKTGSGKIRKSVLRDQAR